MKTHHEQRPTGNGPRQWQAAAALGRLWSHLGFEPFRNGVHVLDLALVTLDDAIQRLQQPNHTANVTWARSSENDYPSTQVDHLQTRPQVVYLRKHGTTTQVPQIRGRHNSDYADLVIMPTFA
jgi:hypothetical protein